MVMLGVIILGVWLLLVPRMRLPIYPGAQQIQVTSLTYFTNISTGNLVSDEVLSFTTNDSVADVLAFFEAHVSSGNWITHNVDQSRRIFIYHQSLPIPLPFLEDRTSYVIFLTVERQENSTPVKI
jgi:hypothetical protein